MMFNDLELLRIFLELAKHKSFTKTSKIIGLSPSYISKKIKLLEEQLGHSLLYRNTRNVSLTTQGHSLIPKALKLLAMSEALAQEEKNITKKKTITITTTETFATSQLIPIFKDIEILFPEIRINLILENKLSDLVKESIDIAIRFYKPYDSNYKAIKLRPNDLTFYATRKYIQNSGNNLFKNGIFYQSDHSSLKIVNSKKKISEYFGKSRIDTESGILINHAIFNGLGIGVRPRWNIEPFLDKYDLLEVPCKERIKTINDCYLLYHNGKQPSYLKSLILFLKERLILNY